MAMAPLFLELLRNPESLPLFAMPGILWAFGHAVAGRPAVATLCHQSHDAINVLMGIMRATPPHELISTAGFARRGGHAQVMPDMKELVEALQLGGADVTPQLLSSGYIDVLMETFEAVEQVGQHNVTGHHLSWGLILLKELVGERLGEIEQEYRAHQEALRYLMQHPVYHSLEQGFTTSVIGAVIVAQLFVTYSTNVIQILGFTSALGPFVTYLFLGVGKDEDNSFGFVQEDMDGYLLFFHQNMRKEGPGVL
jgi:hypothetical protein